MTNVEVLSAYAAMAALTKQMVAAATAADWDGLEGLEQQVSSHVAQLRDNEAAVTLDAGERQQKLGLIKQMLDDDRQIRDLTMPWMAQLSKLINNTGTERRLAAAYGAV
ncbi:flagellar protein FliT [Pseudoduganella sp.]|uniref:flagellar protein FliT n=1 Tax=Pseudoduganella sp. TaxID=1880898 RepID=UPI0035B0DEF1